MQFVSSGSLHLERKKWQCLYFSIFLILYFNPIPPGGVGGGGRHKVPAQLLISCPRGNFWYFS